ncbi:MAG: hypothetical protein Q9201_007491 [Fulgogasparrea decipioides]
MVRARGTSGHENDARSLIRKKIMEEDEYRNVGRDKQGTSIINTGESAQLPVPSFDGGHIAVIAGSHLLIRSSSNGNILQTYELPLGFAHSCRFIRWYRRTSIDGGTSLGDGSDIGHDEDGPQWLLLADDARIMVYDVSKPQLYGEIRGATNLTKLAGVDFGRTPEEIMVFSDFGLKLQIWSLTSKRAVEVKDPKAVSANYSYRSSTGHLALLTRPAAHDILVIMAPHTHEVLTTVELATVDARGVVYSPDGNWLAIWDTASAGCRVLLLTADGHHFKTFTLPQDELNLGVSQVQWSPAGDGLAIGDHRGSVTILHKHTFLPRMRLFHHPTIDIPHGIVWQEEIGPSLTRSYAEARQPAESPLQESFQTGKERVPGTGLVKFNISGTLLASTSSITPSTLWMYSLRSGQPLTALIHHSPVKSIRWHRIIADLLLITCATPEPILYIWRASWARPKILSLPLKAPSGQPKALWLSLDDNVIRFMLSNTDQSAIGRISPDGEEVPWHQDGGYLGKLGSEDMFDEGHSLELSPIKVPEENGAYPNDTPTLGLSTQLCHTSTIEDTFQFRRQS